MHISDSTLSPFRRILSNGIYEEASVRKKYDYTLLNQFFFLYLVFNYNDAWIIRRAHKNVCVI